MSTNSNIPTDCKPSEAEAEAEAERLADWVDTLHPETGEPDGPLMECVKCRKRYRATYVYQTFYVCHGCIEDLANGISWKGSSTLVFAPHGGAQ